MENYIGELLDGRYEIKEIVGTGGMAVVYKARCNRLNRMVAIKILKKDLLQDAELRRRFHAESQAVAMLSHPNIVGVYDVSHSEDQDYIVMELVEGISLKQYLDQKKILNWREALHFATQIAKALEHAHSRGIIHRDIKPHNVMILKDGSVKVADFGIAQISSAQDTLTREALGSVHYISPEQAKGAHTDARSDLYSLGVVLYEMLTGRPPYDGSTPVAVAIQHINATPAAPHVLNAAIPLGLEQITMHCMAADVDKRYANATQLLEDLEEFRKNPNTTFDFSKPRGESGVAHLIHQAARRPEREQEEHKAREEKEAARKRAKQTEREQQEQRKGRRLSVIVVVVCIALALAGIGYFLYSYLLSDLFSRTEEAVVPNFIGQYYEEIDPAQYPDFTIEVQSWKASDAYEAGKVIDQTPVGNRNAKVGTGIKLTISAGADNVTMPKLINSTMQNAQTLLDTLPLELKLQTVYEPSEVYTEGYIISTEPAFGEPLADGQTIVLHVSQGTDAELVPVPPLVGLTVEQAQARIAEAGLSLGGSTSVDSELPEGTVTFQSVEADEMVKKETVINLQISKGPEQAEQPVLLSQSEDQVVFVDGVLALEVTAAADDDGSISYAWYMTVTGSYADSVSVSPAAENNTVCMADTGKAGTYYYYCRVTNTLGESTSETYSRLIRVTVEEAAASSQREILVDMPSDTGFYQVSVYVDRSEQIPPFTVNMDEIPGKTIALTVSGTGVQMVYIYVDNQEYDSQLIDFDTVG